MSNSCVSIVLFPLLSLFDETPAKREEQERDWWHLNVGAGGQVMAVCHRLTFLKKGISSGRKRKKKRPKGRERAIKQMAASTEILSPFVQLFFFSKSGLSFTQMIGDNLLRTYLYTCGILIHKWAIGAADATRCFF